MVVVVKCGCVGSKCCSIKRLFKLKDFKLAQKMEVGPKFFKNGNMLE